MNWNLIWKMLIGIVFSKSVVTGPSGIPSSSCSSFFRVARGRKVRIFKKDWSWFAKDVMPQRCRNLSKPSERTHKTPPSKTSELRQAKYAAAQKAQALRLNHLWEQPAY
ncbi:MAG TPA: hypothetical protein VFZ08_07395 [Terriglobia bacterium]|nr:hypothetical protein [Terriglobia bacterium]